MIAMTLGEVAGIVGATLHGADPAALVTAPVEFDSREVAAGGLFLALPGEQVDGHDYVAQAIGRGAVAAIVTRPVPEPSLLVADGLAALGALAGALARRLDKTTIVGITGSSGKTSTKDLVAAVLASAGPTVAPPGSFNNELGYPYTVLRADERTRFLVLEASARGIGHIRYLTSIAAPRIGVVLNVGTAHLGEFGSREAIAQAKGELVEALPSAEAAGGDGTGGAGGVAILNADDPLVLAMATRTTARVVTTGRGAGADVRAERVGLDAMGRAGFELVAGGERAPVQLQLIGEHQVGNALAAAAVALECGLPLPATAAALGAARAASHWRMEPTERADGVLVLNDAYNANPESTRAALETLVRIARGRRTRALAVLGPMAELGSAEVQAHEQIGRLAAELGVDRLLAVGQPARPVARAAAAAASRPGMADAVADTDAAIAWLRAELRAGDVVLVKASHAASLERVALAIVEDGATVTNRGPEDSPA